MLGNPELLYVTYTWPGMPSFPTLTKLLSLNVFTCEIVTRTNGLSFLWKWNDTILSLQKEMGVRANRRKLFKCGVYSLFKRLILSCIFISTFIFTHYFTKYSVLWLLIIVVLLNFVPNDILVLVLELLIMNTECSNYIYLCNSNI